MNNLKKEEIRKIIENEISEMGFELVDIKVNISSNSSYIRIFVDKSEGVTISECAKINNSISDLIFRKDLFPKNYQLEVSSPGLDRPLKSKRDFQRNISRNILLEYGEMSDLKKIEGKIISADDELIISNSNNKTFPIPFNLINKGKIKLPW